MKYDCILVDPPWKMKMGQWRAVSNRPQLPYSSMSIDEIKALNVQQFAADDCHLWLWATNQTLPNAFDIINDWGFKYLSPIVWVKPSGMGAWFVSRTEFLLFCYRGKCELAKRYEPNVIFANTLRHSEKPEVFYELIERVSYNSRLELFARKIRPGWDAWGNEIPSYPEIHLSEQFRPAYFWG